MRFLLLISFLLSTSACTRKALPPEAEHLRRQIGRTQRQLARLEVKLKDASEDPGLRAALHEEEELAKSRLARLVRNWELAQPGVPTPTWDGTLDEEAKGFSADQKE